MRRLVALGSLATTGFMLIGGALESGADTVVPKLSHVSAKPTRFCARKTSTCRHARTKVSFTVSTNARVVGDMRPRSRFVGSLIEFRRNFKRGPNSVYIHDTRLTPDRWTIRLQATNTVGGGPIKLIDVRVVKHD